MGTGAIAISLPFSCMLGLLSSMTSSTMGRLANIARPFALKIFLQTDRSEWRALSLILSPQSPCNVVPLGRSEVMTCHVRLLRMIACVR